MDVAKKPKSIMIDNSKVTILKYLAYFYSLFHIFYIFFVLIPEVKSVCATVAVVEEVRPNQIQAFEVKADGTDVCLALIDCERTCARGGVPWKKDQPIAL